MSQLSHHTSLIGLDAKLISHRFRIPAFRKCNPKCHAPGEAVGSSRRASLPKLHAAVLDQVASGQDTQQSPSTAPSDQAPFCWSKQWYAVSLLEALELKKPHPIKLLGKELVLWRDTSGTWQCFEDRCSHRQAPLSEGRVLGDTLMCSYHGWQFAQGGRCVNVPQAEGTRGNERACASPRSCVASFPTTVKQGIVWVWAEPGPLAAIEAAAKGPTLIPWISEDDVTRTPEGVPVITVVPGMQRDLPISYEHQMENLADPAHFNFAHHGVAGDMLHESAGTAHVEAVTSDEETAPAVFDGAEGLAYWVDMLMGVGRSVEHNLHHIVFPGLFTLKTFTPKDFPGVDWELLEIHAVPTEPGHVRLLVRVFLAGHNLPLMPRLVSKYIPTWLSHIRGLEITDGDTVILSEQDRITRSETERSGQEWSKQYYMPTSSDRLVVATRKWLDSRGGGGPFPSARPLPAMTNEQMTDRYSQHTSDCPSCSAALRNFRALRVMAGGLSVAFLGAAITNASITAGRSLAPVWLAAAAAVLGAVAAAAHNYAQRLVLARYHHYEHN